MSPFRLSLPVRRARAIGRFVFTAAILTAPAVAQNPAAGPVKGASVEGITEYTLGNGLRILLFPDQSKPQTTVNVTYLVGSRNEGFGETGMAHLLEHMMYKGSVHHPNPSAEIQARTGGGANFNASTEFDRTHYYEVFPAADSNLVWALDLEADRMVNSFIAKKALESEFSVVRSEFEMNENDFFLVTINHVLGAAYQFHAYKHLPIGSKADIENVPIDKLQAFYHKYYQPDNAIVTIVGNFDEKRALDLVQQKFGAIPRPSRVLEQPYTVEPTQDGEREVYVRRAGDTQVLLAFYHVPGGAHPDFAAIDVLTRVLGDGPNSRLYQALVTSKRAAVAGANNFQQHDPGGLFAFARLRKEQSMDSAKAAMWSAIQEIVTTKPPTSEEVERAKTGILKDFDLALTRPNTFGRELAEWSKIGDWRLFFVHRDRIKAVTVADVQRVAAAYLKPSNRTVGVFVPTDKPDRAEIPANPNVDSIVKNYKGNAVVAAGEAFDPSPANIESRLKRSTLPSGMKVALLSKKNRGEAVNAVITLRYGTEQTLTNRMAVANLTAGMLMRGTKEHTRQQIQDELDRLKARVMVGPMLGGVRATIETTRPNLPAVMKLVAEVLREPAFPQSEFEQLQSQAIAGMESQKSEPMALAQIALQQQLNSYPKGHPRHVNSMDESIADAKAVTVPELRKFHEEFYGASNGELVVVGDFDNAQVAGEASELFGSWKSKAPYTPIPEVLTTTAALNKSIETPDKANADLWAGRNFSMKDTDPAYAALLVADYIFGASALDSRLGNRLRQKEGLTYMTQSAANVSSTDQVGHWLAVAIFNPTNLQKLESSFMDEVSKAASGGFTADEVAKAKTSILQNRRTQRASDAALANLIDNELYLGRTMQFDTDLDTRIASVTPEEASAAMKRAVDPTKLVIVKAGDFAKAAQAGEKKP